MADSNWTRAASLDALEDRGRLVFRKDGRQIALFHTARGLFACNNRCPHEGYPLREGSLDARCILTCNWHNWKFDLESGRNLYGGEGLRTYPVEVRGGEVWIDLADPPFAERRARILASLAEAREDNAYERMARELARLHRLGADPLDALRESIHWSFDRMEFGWTHAYARAPRTGSPSTTRTKATTRPASPVCSKPSRTSPTTCCESRAIRSRTAPGPGTRRRSSPPSRARTRARRWRWCGAASPRGFDSPTSNGPSPGPRSPTTTTSAIRSST